MGMNGIELKRIIESMAKLEEAGVNLEDCVFFAYPDPKTQFIIMQMKDIPGGLSEPS